MSSKKRSEMQTLKINGLEYSIEFVDPDSKALHDDGTHTYIGITFHSTGHICINNNLTPGLTRRTVAHEIAHAYMYAHGFSDIKTFTDEDVCEVLTAYGEAIFRDTDDIMMVNQKREAEMDGN